MKVLIYGNGWLGKKFAAHFQAEISPHRIKDLASLEQDLQKYKPDVVINCVAKTGAPNIDWCEDHKEETLFANVNVPILLAEACKRNNIFFVHLSSGCIYQGDNNGKGFSEEDTPNFFGSFYSKTKIMAEVGLKNYQALILRLRMPIDSVPGERNFIDKIVRYSKVINVPNSMTCIDDLLFAAPKLIERRATGTYHITNPGAITHEEILQLYKEIVNPKHTYELITLEQLHLMTKAHRSNCILNTEKLQKEGIELRPIKQAVRNSLEVYKQHLL
ncbi:sugar nucleotide-binding protein [Candidatus Woesearchaeota archaeon]|nr:sugar nucleotide-binding protein [Candidatus Woesearchaeota archaeon]